MSLLRAAAGPSLADRLHAQAGRLIVEKSAGDAVPAYNLTGTLYRSGSGWILLQVPNALVRGVFAAMNEPGAELPPSGDDGRLNAHISVFRADELDALGGADAITERGKQFKYSIGRLMSVEPATWDGMSRVWFLKVHSPELQALRRSYGLSSLPNDGKYDFHITVAARKKGVLGRNRTAKSN